MCHPAHPLEVLATLVKVQVQNNVKIGKTESTLEPPELGRLLNTKFPLHHGRFPSLARDFWLLFQISNELREICVPSR